MCVVLRFWLYSYQGRHTEIECFAPDRHFWSMKRVFHDGVGISLVNFWKKSVWGVIAECRQKHKLRALPRQRRTSFKKYTQENIVMHTYR